MARLPLVLGHRGASAYAPMNTLPAFFRAIEQGADGVELDVHLSKDGHLVVVHDFTVDHTTNGSGTVQNMTLAELKALDAGSWKSDAFTGTRIPTLDEVFDAIGARSRLINVEIKAKNDETDGVEAAVAACIERHNIGNRILVSSFNPYALQRFHAALPAVPIGYLYDPEDTLHPEVMESLPHQARHPYHPIVDAAYMAWANQNGYQVNTWTVNDPQRALELRDLGVHALITDQPDVILAALRG